MGFLDEWDDFLHQNASPEDKPTIENLKKIAEPAIKRIRQWKDMNEFRNTVIAHHLRKNKKFKKEYVFIGDHVKNLVIPDHISEILLLSEMISIATKIVIKPFEKEVKEFINELHTPKEIVFPKPIDFDAELQLVLTQIDDLVKKYRL